MHFVYTTLPNWLEAQSFAAQLIEQKLAACVNILPEMMSLYEWQGEIKQEQEVVVLIKTTQAKISALETFCKENHPYDEPAFIHWPAGASATFEQWVQAQTSG